MFYVMQGGSLKIADTGRPVLTDPIPVDERS